MIDYQRIIEELDDTKVMTLFDKMDIPYIDKGDYLLLPTVCHHDSIDEASWKLYYYKNTHLMVCYSNCGNMSLFNFLKHFYEARGYEYDWYRDIYEVITGCSTFSETNVAAPQYKAIRDNYHNKKERKKLPTYPNGIIEMFPKYYPVEWLNDGITEEAMDKYNIRFSTIQNKVIIPHYDINNNLVGIRGRALNKEEEELVGKYMPVQIEGKWYSHPLSLNLYALNMNKNHIKKTGIAYLCESEKAVLQVESFNMVNCTCAVCGNKLNKYIVDLLMRYGKPREVVVCFDKEELEGEDKYFNKLYEMCSKYKRYADFSFVYDRENLLDLKDSPTDKGEETFRKLLKHRVKV